MDTRAQKVKQRLSDVLEQLTFDATILTMRLEALKALNASDFSSLKALEREIHALHMKASEEVCAKIKD
jgi:hypothetical protein